MPLAWVLPPVQVEIGAGARHGVNGSRLDLVVPLGVGFYPMQLAAEQVGRAVEFGAGYHFEGLIFASYHHGPYLDLGFSRLVGILPNESTGNSSSLRLQLGARGYYHFSHQGGAGVGPGAALRLGFESVNFTSGPLSSCTVAEPTIYPPGEPGKPNPFTEDLVQPATLVCGAGLMYGEAGIGLFTELGHAWLGEREATMLLFGITFRVPASVGAGFATLF